MSHHEETISNPREHVMKRIRAGSALGIVSIAVLFGWVTAVSAQTFSSGSNGTLGAFAPGANATVVVPSDGVLNYTTITVPAGVTVSFTPNAANTPVTMLATGDVSIAGTVNLDGTKSTCCIVSPGFVPGKPGGPGGFAGGAGGMGGLVNTFGSPGLGPGGGLPVTTNTSAQYGAYGAPNTFMSFLPLFGGSGGAGSPQFNSSGTIFAGEPGAGGGGAIVVASTTKITVTSTGTITARGGDHASAFVSNIQQTGGVGSGGAIRLVAP